MVVSLFEVIIAFNHIIGKTEMKCKLSPAQEYYVTYVTGYTKIQSYTKFIQTIGKFSEKLPKNCIWSEMHTLNSVQGKTYAQQK